MSQLVTYYQKRAEEHDLVYQKPERQVDLALIKEYMTKQFIDKSTIEIACGTGYWTEIFSRMARAIYATDINPDVIKIARKKLHFRNNVLFDIKDLRDTQIIPGAFEGLFGGFIWSHIPNEEIENFLHTVVNHVAPSAELIFLDNKYIEGSSLPISRTDENGNTFQIRQPKSGDKFEIMKNFPDRERMEKIMKNFGGEFQWVAFQHYWIMKFRKVKESIC